MEKLRASFNASFSTKVLLPIVTSMISLLTVTVWVMDRRIAKQFQADAARSLKTADAVFRSSQSIHTRNLLARFHSLSNEPRYRAAFQTGHVPTLRDQIKDLPADQGVDVAMFSSGRGELLASAKGDPLIPIGDFDRSCAAAINRALKGEETVDTVRMGHRLFDVVALPVQGNDGELIGVLTFGTEIGDAVAHEFSLVTRSQIALLADGHVVASTVPVLETHDQLTSLFLQCSGVTNAAAPRQIQIGDEHYFCAAGHFSSLAADSGLGYLLLSSYEQPLRAFQATQQLLLWVSSLCIVSGVVIVWFAVRKTTRPLRDLRDSAEAVGRGDFSRSVEVTSSDECGELACVFNQMTENVKRSQDELQKTVETLKTTQAQLIQSEKLSGIGEFVAGVAHELNNPLTSVMGFSELLARASDDPQQRRYLEIIHKSALRCQKIVQSLLSFSRRHAPERKPANVNTLVGNAVEFLQYQLRTSNLEILTHLDPNIPKAMLDPHQIQQVFLNIINNARQAIEGNTPKGRITITTTVVRDKIRVEFQDNGPGIKPENLPKLFDPFFTTKKTGQGTGLGLSLCYGIIKEHGGTIDVRSKPGESACFIIQLPLTAVPPGVPDAEAIPVPAVSPDNGRGKKVLVIDDEEQILEMIKAVLVNHGYEVDIAQDGETGLNRLSQHRYDLTLCDWKMPGMNGEQVYERACALNPGLSKRMVFITGDVISDKVQQFITKRNTLCLPKPFSLAQFQEALGQALKS